MQMKETRKTITQMSLFAGGKVIVSARQGQSVPMSEAMRRRLAKRSRYAQERALSQAMMEEITSHQNLLRSYRRVVSNGGSAGIDGMQTKELKNWLRTNYTKLREQLMSGTYRPQGVKGVEIPKPNGSKRQLGIPTVVDRLVQQAIAQVMMRQYEPTFSEHSYGFRPKRNCHQALQQATSWLPLWFHSPDFYKRIFF